MTVAAADNNQCFDPTVTVTDVNLTLSAKPACTARVLYSMQRTWRAVDKASNSVNKSQTIWVADDQVPGVPTIRVQLSRWWLRSLDRVSVPVTWGLKNPLKKVTRKTYAWKVTPQRGAGAAVTKQGGGLLPKEGKAEGKSVMPGVHEWGRGDGEGGRVAGGRRVASGWVGWKERDGGC